MLEIRHYPFPPVGDAPAPVARDPFPAPTLTSRDEPIASLPGPVALLAAEAAGLGWKLAGPWQSIGHTPHSIRGTPSAKAKTLWAMRLQRGKQSAVAVRTDGAWTSFWTWSDEHFFQRHATLEAFKEALR
jgi:hypothetical protein